MEGGRTTKPSKVAVLPRRAGFLNRCAERETNDPISTPVVVLCSFMKRGDYTKFWVRLVKLKDCVLIPEIVQVNRSGSKYLLADSVNAMKVIHSRFSDSE